MSVVTVMANQLIVDINGETYECQIEEAHVTYPDATGGTKRYTGCPDGEVTIPDPAAVGVVANLQLVGLHDWSDAGISWVLTEAYGTTVPFILNLDVDKAAATEGPSGTVPAQARTYTGTLRIPRISDDWITRQAEDIDVTFDCVTMTGPTRYTAP
jgi:hypothetical protein